MQTQEIRHSFFLAFLLNPRDQHPFRDMFVKEIVEEKDAEENVKKIKDNRKHSDYLCNILQKFVFKITIIWK